MADILSALDDSADPPIASAETAAADAVQMAAQRQQPVAALR